MQVGWVKIGDFRQITGYISKTVNDRHMFLLKSNRKSYALYRMVTLPLTLETSDFFYTGRPCEVLVLIVMSECSLSGRGQGHGSNSTFWT